MWKRRIESRRRHDWLLCVFLEPWKLVGMYTGRSLDVYVRMLLYQLRSRTAILTTDSPVPCHVYL